MDITILLAKVFGIYMIIGGVAIMLRQRYFMPVIGAFAKERLTRLVVAILELIGGLLIIMTHNVWGSLPEIVVSLFGWIMAIEGAFYMLAPDETVEHIIEAFNVKAWYTFGGLFSIVLGAYLAGGAFGLF